MENRECAHFWEYGWNCLSVHLKLPLRIVLNLIMKDYKRDDVYLVPAAVRIGKHKYKWNYLFYLFTIQMVVLKLVGIKWTLSHFPVEFKTLFYLIVVRLNIPFKDHFSPPK